MLNFLQKVYLPMLEPPDGGAIAIQQLVPTEHLWRPNYPRDCASLTVARLRNACIISCVLSRTPIAYHRAIFKAAQQNSCDALLTKRLSSFAYGT